MDPLRLATAALEFGVSRYTHRSSHRATSLALLGAGIVCGCGAGGFAITALLIYLIPILGAAEAALTVAGVLIAVALSALFLSHHLSRQQQRNGTSAQQPQQLDLQALAAGAEEFVRENKALSLSAAFVAGLLVSDEMSKRR